MIYRSKLFKDLTTLVLLLLAVYLAYALFPLMSAIWAFLVRIFFPFVLAVIFYYLLRPLVRSLQKLMPLPLAIGITFIFVIFSIIFISIFIYPNIITQIELLNSLKIGNIIQFKNETLTNLLGLERYLEHAFEETISEFLTSINSFLVKQVIDFIASLTEFVLSLVSAFFILFFLLKDDKKIYQGFCKQIPEKYVLNVRGLLNDIDMTLLGFINGRIVISLIISSILFLVFLIIGLPYAVILAIISLIFYIIPTLGAFIAIIPPSLVGFSESTFTGFEVLIIMIIASNLESLLLMPFVMRKKLYIHPLTVIFILLVAGNLYGIFGLLFATPVYVIIKVIIDHIYKFTQKCN